MKLFKRFSGCKTIRKDFDLLQKVFKENIKKIQNDWQNKGPNYLQFLFDRGLILEMDSLYMDDILKNLIKQEKNFNNNIVNNLIDIQMQIDNKHYVKNLDSFQQLNQIIKNFVQKNYSLFGQKRLDQIFQIPELFNKDIFKLQENYKILSHQEKTKIIFQQLQIEELYHTEKDKIQIEKIDFDQFQIVLNLLKTNQKLFLNGCSKNSKHSIQKFCNDFKDNSISTLIMEDYPILTNPESDQEVIQNYETEQIEQIVRDPVNFFYKFQNQELLNYMHSFLHSDSFKLDTKNNLIYQKTNPLCQNFSELGSILLNFILNSKQKDDLQLVVCDLPIQQQIQKMTMDFTLTQLEQLLHQINYITLIEKLHKSQMALNEGCPNCTGSPQRDVIDHFSVIAGDSQFPLQHKINHINQMIQQYLFQNPDRENIMIMTGNYYQPEILKFLYHSQQQQKFVPLKQKNILKKNQKQFRQYNEQISEQESEEFMAKTALLETIYQTIDQSSLNELGHTNIQWKLYLEYADKYIEMNSLEYLSGVNPPTAEDMDKNCIADSLIFGYFEREVFEKPVDFNDYNPETNTVKAPIQYPSDTLLVNKEEEIEQMRKIFDQLRKNCLLKVRNTNDTNLKIQVKRKN